MPQQHPPEHAIEPETTEFKLSPEDIVEMIERQGPCDYNELFGRVGRMDHTVLAADVEQAVKAAVAVGTLRWNEMMLRYEAPIDTPARMETALAEALCLFVAHHREMRERGDQEIAGMHVETFDERGYPAKVGSGLMVRIGKQEFQIGIVKHQR